MRPCNGQQLYVGTELGVFASDDAGVTWTPANGGLAHTIVETLDFKNANSLVAFTHGRGAFIAELEPCGSGAIPALSEWGMVCMAFLMIGAAIFVTARRPEGLPG